MSTLTNLSRRNLLTGTIALTATSIAAPAIIRAAGRELRILTWEGYAEPEWLEKFKKAVKDIPEIIDIYRMSGEIDYLLKAYVSDISGYDRIYRKLISRIDLSDVTSMFAMEELKATTEIPLVLRRPH